MSRVGQVAGTLAELSGASFDEIARALNQYDVRDILAVVAAGGSGGGGSDSTVQQATAVLDAVDILALFDTPYLLVEQEANTFVRILELYGQTQGATPYTIGANIQIVDGGALSPVNLSGLASALQIGGGLLSIDKTERDLNTGLTGGYVEYGGEISPKLQAQTSNPTGGDLTLTVTVLYTTINLI